MIFRKVLKQMGIHESLTTAWELKLDVIACWKKFEPYKLLPAASRLCLGAFLRRLEIQIIERLKTSPLHIGLRFAILALDIAEQHNAKRFVKLFFVNSFFDLYFELRFVKAFSKREDNPNIFRIMSFDVKNKIEKN